MYLHIGLKQSKGSKNQEGYRPFQMNLSALSMLCDGIEPVLVRCATQHCFKTSASFTQSVIRELRENNEKLPSLFSLFSNIGFWTCLNYFTHFSKFVAFQTQGLREFCPPRPSLYHVSYLYICEYSYFQFYQCYAYML